MEKLAFIRVTALANVVDWRDRPVLEEAPASVAVVFDASRSLRRALPDARAAVQAVPAGARPADDAVLIVCNGGPSVQCGFGAAPGEIASLRTEAHGGGSLDALGPPRPPPQSGNPAGRIGPRLQMESFLEERLCGYALTRSPSAGCF